MKKGSNQVINFLSFNSPPHQFTRKLIWMLFHFVASLHTTTHQTIGNIFEFYDPISSQKSINRFHILPLAAQNKTMEHIWGISEKYPYLSTRFHLNQPTKVIRLSLAQRHQQQLSSPSPPPSPGYINITGRNTYRKVHICRGIGLWAKNGTDGRMDGKSPFRKLFFNLVIRAASQAVTLWACHLINRLFLSCICSLRGSGHVHCVEGG